MLQSTACELPSHAFPEQRESARGDEEEKLTGRWKRNIWCWGGPASPCSCRSGGDGAAGEVPPAAGFSSLPLLPFSLSSSLPSETGFLPIYLWFHFTQSVDSLSSLSCPSACTGFLLLARLLFLPSVPALFICCCGIASYTSQRLNRPGDDILTPYRRHSQILSRGSKQRQPGAPRRCIVAITTIWRRIKNHVQ